MRITIELDGGQETTVDVNQRQSSSASTGALRSPAVSPTASAVDAGPAPTGEQSTPSQPSAVSMMGSPPISNGGGESAGSAPSMPSSAEEEGLA